MTDTIASAEIVDVRATPRTLWRHVLLRSSGGLIGVGEASLNGAPPDLSRRLSRAAQVLTGRAIGSETMTPLAALLDGDLADATVHSALEQAVTDLAAQDAGVPVHRLLSPDREPFAVPLYANINRKTDSRAPADFAANAAAAVTEGHGAVKLAPFDDLTPDLCGTPEGARLIDAGLARVAAVAEAVPGTELQVDCHWRFTEDAATAVLDDLARLGVTWFECPLPETNAMIPAIRRLRSKVNDRAMRLAGLECAVGWEGFRPFVIAEALDVVMPDIKHCGGYAALLDIAARSAEHGTAVSPHNPSGPISHLASVHASVAAGTSERLEVQWRESPVFDAICLPWEPAEGATAQPPGRPGLGARLVSR